jgi:hypothetical protein
MASELQVEAMTVSREEKSIVHASRSNDPNHARLSTIKIAERNLAKPIRAQIASHAGFANQRSQIDRQVVIKIRGYERSDLLRMRVNSRQQRETPKSERTRRSSS